MFNRETILKSLNSENYYIDKHSLDLFLEDWKIDSIYEDDDGLEFYDDLALEKIKKGISLKAQGYSDDQIITKLAKIEAKVEKSEEPPKPVQPILVSELPEMKEHFSDSAADTEEEIDNDDNNTTEEYSTEEFSNERFEAPVEIPEYKKSEVAAKPEKSFTLDVSSQTLQMLAEAVAKKISDDIKNSDLSKQLVEAGGYKRDNEILAKQVQDLLKHNKELSDRIEQLENNVTKGFWAKFWNKN